MAVIFSLMYGFSLASEMSIEFCTCSHRASMGCAGLKGFFIILLWSTNAAGKLFPCVVKICGRIFVVVMLA